MKIVPDTNVLLAGFFTRGLCEGLLDLCISNPQHELISSQHILDEFAEHAGKFRASPSEIQETLAFLSAHIRVVTPVAVDANACRDRDDLPVLGTLLAGAADCLVTGDKDLLVLKVFERIPIHSPRALYDLLIRAQSQ